MRTDEWIVVLVLAVLLVFMWRWLKKWGQETAEKQYAANQRAADLEVLSRISETGLTPLNSTPDSPMPFGYKMSWAVVRCDDPEQVIEVLDPLAWEPANWETGVTRAYANYRKIFVSPCLDGFVLVIGDVPFYRLKDLAQDFEEAQAFFSYRTSDCYSWTKYVRGELVRAYTCLDDIVDEDFGELTPEELALGFDRFSPDGSVWPDEEDVLSIVAAWGIDPKFEKKTYLPGTGWLCTVD